MSTTLIEELEQAADWIDFDETFSAALRARIARLRELEREFGYLDSWLRIAGPLDPREEPGT